jgi:hypothetical protein
MKNKLKQFMGAWKGDDLKECIAMVYASRGKFYLVEDDMPIFIESLGGDRVAMTRHDYERLMKLLEESEEENKALKKLNEQFEGKPVGVTEWEQLVAENEKLRAENEQLTGISGQLKAANQSLWNVIKNGADTVCNNSDLAAENAQLKAQLEKLKTPTYILSDSPDRCEIRCHKCGWDFKCGLNRHCPLCNFDNSVRCGACTSIMKRITSVENTICGKEVVVRDVCPDCHMEIIVT